MKPKILVILGPTATGKSDLAVKLAKKYRGEVISADSRQVYKGLDIGTGKVTKEEMQGIHHWLLDVENPKNVFNVADYKKLADEKIKTILKRSKLPIICGGTGFYIDAVIKNIDLPEVKPDLKLRKDLEEKSLEELQETLLKLDPIRYKSIDLKNKVRLVRAIEIAKHIGKVPEIKTGASSFDVLQIGLHLDTEALRKKINKRIISRIKQGMIEEAVELNKKGLSFERMRELGLEYRYLADYLESKIDKKKLALKLQNEIWHYAKRQMTWFKRDKSIKWFNPNEFKKIENIVSKFLKN
jgi:tRNA dimethylallyltransferase